MTVNGAFWRYFKQFGTAEINKNKNRDGKGCILTAFERLGTADNILKKDAKWCILTASETIWNYKEKNENRDGK